MSVIDVNQSNKKPIQNDGFWSIQMQRLCFDHVKRGLQVGSAFGMLAVLPWTIFKDLKNLKALSFRRIMNRQAAALTVGIGLSMGWMGIKYFSWQNRQQKLYDETYYLPNELQHELDTVATYWGGGAFLLSLAISRKLVLSFGMMSPVIALGMIQVLLNRNQTSNSN